MFKLIDKILLQFSPCFKRIETFSWFIIIVIGMMLRIDTKGITTIIGCMNLEPRYYESMIHFFRSNSFSLEELKKQWQRIVNNYINPVTIDDRQIILGDHIKIMKEARYMPGIKKHFQDSENVGKSEYIFGHQHGMIGILANGDTHQCIPLDIEIHGGVEDIDEMKSDINTKQANLLNEQHLSKENENSIEKISKMTENYVETTKNKVFLVLDAFFPSKTLFNSIKDFNGKIKEKMITIIVRAKSNYVAYEKPIQNKLGRKRKYGEKVKLSDLFDKIDELFTETKMKLYGKNEVVHYYCIDLLWKPIEREVRFILVKTGSKKMVLMCSDLSLQPEKAILTYTYRFKIEVSFKYLKHTLGSFFYHFWTKAMPKLSRYTTKTNFSSVTNDDDKAKIIDTKRAIEVYTFISSIAYGIMTIIALRFSNNIWTKFAGWIRTKSSKVPSLEIVRGALTKEYYSNFINLSNYATLSKIKKYQRAPELNYCGANYIENSSQVSGL